MACPASPSLLLLLAGISAIAVSSGSLAAQGAPTFARIESYNTVELLDLQQKTWRKIHEVPEWATELSVAPSGDRLAFLSWTEVSMPDRDSPQKNSELVVIDTAGKSLPTRIKQVQRYAWCGSGCLVYITGQREESHYGFVPEAIGMLHVKTGKMTKMPAPSTPIAITWARFDSAAYIKNVPVPGEAHIYRLDLAAGTLEPTALLDYMFSPTGRYYLQDPEFTDTLVVRERMTNAAVDLEPMRRNALILGWASSNEDILLTVKRPPRRIGPGGRLRAKKPTDREPDVTYMLYDLARGRVQRTVKGSLRNWAAPDNNLLVQQGRDYHLVGAP